MNTPIRDFVLNYCKKKSVRLHMPGHKGNNFLGFEKYDITEIDGADVLYNAEGIIRQSEENASLLFDSYRTFYSCEGSSLCIKAMLAVIASHRKDKGRKTRILAARNVHKAFVYGCALCDIDVEWIYPSEPSHLCTCFTTPLNLERRLSELGDNIDAVYITSPDYLGQICDIKNLSQVCDRFSLPLLVDNAHGAYLGFLDESIHPINNGAYMCCDSAHKTLPVITGGAYLHLSDKASDVADSVENMMALMGSTSPSYLILQSLDVCNKYLSDGYAERLKITVNRIDVFKENLCSANFSVEESEPLKLVINLQRSGIILTELLSALGRFNVVPEFYDDGHVVFMFTPENTEDDFSKLAAALGSLERRTAAFKNEGVFWFGEAKRSMSIREAVFSEKDTIRVEDAEGRVCASPAVSCPPAVPPVISGEVISDEAIKCMLYYGIDKIEVVK